MAHAAANRGKKDGKPSSFNETLPTQEAVTTERCMIGNGVVVSARSDAQPIRALRAVHGYRPMLARLVSEFTLMCRHLPLLIPLPHFGRPVSVTGLRSSYACLRVSERLGAFTNRLLRCFVMIAPLILGASAGGEAYLRLKGPDGRPWLDWRKDLEARRAVVGESFISGLKSGAWGEFDRKSEEFLAAFPTGSLAADVRRNRAISFEIRSDIASARSEYAAITRDSFFFVWGAEAEDRMRLLDLIGGSVQELSMLRKAELDLDENVGKAALKDLAARAKNREIVAQAEAHIVLDLASSFLRQFQWRRFVEELGKFIASHPDTLASRALARKAVGLLAVEATIQRQKKDELDSLRTELRGLANRIIEDSPDPHSVGFAILLSATLDWVILTGYVDIEQPMHLSDTQKSVLRRTIADLEMALPRLKSPPSGAYAEGLRELVKLSLLAGDTAAAEARYQILARECGPVFFSADALYMIAKFYERQGDAARSLGLYREIVATYPEAGVASHAYYDCCWPEAELRAATERLAEGVPKQTSVPKHVCDLSKTILTPATATPDTCAAGVRTIAAIAVILGSAGILVLVVRAWHASRSSRQQNL